MKHVLSTEGFLNVPLRRELIINVLAFGSLSKIPISETPQLESMHVSDNVLAINSGLSIMVLKIKNLTGLKFRLIFFLESKEFYFFLKNNQLASPLQE